eukprot:TRINITY_DN10151_c0_g1_i1.p3 TRINITY_DN10151_c0_g1~~TRINITY_DN10151_c0_g1_i1.p3  ORF type:complete len:155 (+),score=18.46 TRINITY_DN10151_c0_g1_i1:1217-1681(+)
MPLILLFPVSLLSQTCSRADSSSPSRPNRSSKADTLDKPLAAQVQSQVIVSQTDSEDATGIPSACLQDNARHALIATLAEDYSLNYRQPRQACEHNANVASQHGLHDISQLWTMLRMVLLESLEQTEQAATLQTQTEESVITCMQAVYAECLQS